MTPSNDKYMYTLMSSRFLSTGPVVAPSVLCPYNVVLCLWCVCILSLTLPDNNLLLLPPYLPPSFSLPITATEKNRVRIAGEG